MTGPTRGVRLYDLAREAGVGLRHRWLRAALCALGIALGIAAVVVVLAIPASTQHALLDRLGRDGNLLTVASGNTINNQPVPLPAFAPGMVGRIDGVQRMSSVQYLGGRIARRTAVVDLQNTNGISVLATDPSLLDTLSLRMASGRFLDAATARFPAVVLGSGAAAALGVEHVDPPMLVDLTGADGHGGGYFAVLGVLASSPLAPELDTSALVGQQAAAALLSAGTAPTRIYLRSAPDQVGSVRALLAPTAMPADPGSVSVGRPSDLLVARAEARTSLNALALGLGAVALLVGGVGVANMMVVAVLERRGEIGLRRALGATRTTVSLLFLVESTLLCLLGAAAGAGLGVLVTQGYAAVQHIPPVLPATPTLAGLAGSLLVGLAAGVYPAVRAARLAPSDALPTT
jgi:putative ABC transport system permease protein